MKGKVSIDVVCNTFGKLGGALFQQFLLLDLWQLQLRIQSIPNPFISSLHLSSFYPHTSTYFATTTTNMNDMFSSTLMSNFTCIEHAQDEIYVSKTCPKTVVETSMLGHFRVHHKNHKPGCQWNYLCEK